MARRQEQTQRPGNIGAIPMYLRDLLPMRPDGCARALATENEGIFRLELSDAGVITADFDIIITFLADGADIEAERRDPNGYLDIDQISAEDCLDCETYGV